MNQGTEIDIFGERHPVPMIPSSFRVFRLFRG